MLKGWPKNTHSAPIKLNSVVIDKEHRTGRRHVYGMLGGRRGSRILLRRSAGSSQQAESMCDCEAFAHAVIPAMLNHNRPKTGPPRDLSYTLLPLYWFALRPLLVSVSKEELLWSDNVRARTCVIYLVRLSPRDRAILRPRSSLCEISLTFTMVQVHGSQRAP